MALSANTPRNISDAVPGLIEEFPVNGGDHVYEGAAVGEVSSDGYVRGLTDGDTFHGFAEREADNTDGSDGDIKVAVRRQGDIELPVGGTLSAADLGAAVYATADGTFSKTDSGSDVRIGTISRVISATKAMVFFQGATVRSI